MNKLQYRVKQYSEISTRLACLSNEKLKQILKDAKSIHEGIGGKSALIFINETPVFVKKIPLTDLEQSLENFMSTANIFNLPLYYQYGVGSAGFGVWRELAAHVMTTNWVITGECSNFPLMYHWRILPTQPDDLNVGHWGDIEKYSQYWENSSAIRRRALDLSKASTQIALFLEYVPQNLHVWLKDQIAKGSKTAESAIAFVDENLKITNTFMNTHDLMHFDAHFHNILTDGELLYFSDFGLALSSKFELTTAETEFLKQHHNYDQACTAVNLLHGIITAIFGKDQWEIQLREYIAGEQDVQGIATIIKRYASIALVMDEFFQKLQKESKSTPYPATRLEQLFLKTI